MNTVRFFTVFYAVLLLSACGFDGDRWEHDVPGIGASSSPMATDLTGDGVKDIILGGGAKEFTATETAVIALDGATGERLWSVPGHNQMVGSALFRDITGDGTDDVFIGGRSDMFFAIDGKTGTKLWEYLPYDERTDYVNDTTVLNFFNPRWLPDVNNDRMPDLLLPYGGFVKAKAGDPNRPAGYLVVLSGRDGSLLAKAMVPDGKETYMAPLVHDFGRGLEAIFGTGGEDISGNLYRVAIQDVLREDLAGAKLLISGGDKGFIAPPLLADVNRDGVKDIIATLVNGQIVALDGKNDRELWRASPGGDYDTYVMPAPGLFTDDDVPDFFASFGRGAWPNTDFTVHVLLDGSNGKILFQDTLGTFQYASPVVADFTKDGRDDVMLAINNKTSRPALNGSNDFFQNGLYVYPSGRGEPLLAYPLVEGANLGSTPLVTDLDGDGKIDLVTAYMDDPRNFYSFRNLKVGRREINRDATTISWGQYLGPAE